MRLKQVRIENYRSIDDVTLTIEPLTDKSCTYGLIGVNEAGKSSLLKALSLKEELIPLTLKDFRDKTSCISITFLYDLVSEEREKIYEAYITALVGRQIEEGLDYSELKIIYEFNPSTLKPEIYFAPGIGTCQTETFWAPSAKPLPNEYKTIFWSAEEKYLISKPIELSSFSGSPETISVPLRNCFLLAEIKDIASRIKAIQGDSTEKEELEDQLGESVTRHISTVWPDHPIKVTFSIDNGFINFHVKDLEVTGKAKTADQRSDGFKQFISFLLTISAQNLNAELQNSILLLDEPETHLHPQAQLYLLSELIKITQNERNNITFFATHSNYMIDKTDLSRNFRVEKKQDKTHISRMSPRTSSYASVNYHVFGIPNTDYHNELYGTLHELYQEEAPNETDRAKVSNFDNNYLTDIKQCKRTKPWKNKANQATLHTYIRNCIHHPEGGNQYTEHELKSSIDGLIKILENP